jgi:hypothetical protein
LHHCRWVLGRFEPQLSQEIRLPQGVIEQIVIERRGEAEGFHGKAPRGLAVLEILERNRTNRLYRPRLYSFATK